jgi:fanconi-associated nuclease 1
MEALPVDHARFLLIRLVLRKQGCWFRQCKLEEKYASDLGSKVLDTMKELWTTVITDHPHDSTSAAASSCEAQSKNVRDISISRFATSDEEATIDELLDCLALEEIKTLAKNNHVWSSNMTVSVYPRSASRMVIDDLKVRQLKEALRKHTSTQSTLTFAMVIPKNTSFVPSSSNFTVKDGRLRNQILKLTCLFA